MGNEQANLAASQGENRKPKAGLFNRKVSIVLTLLFPFVICLSFAAVRNVTEPQKTTNAV